MARRSGRPKKSEGPVVTRQELLRLAARAIGRDGLARASMRGIARDAGVSLATLQHHFRTKDVLWKAVIDEVLVPAETRPSPPSLSNFLSQIVLERLGDAVEAPGLTGQILTDSASSDPSLLAYLVDATRGLREEDRRRVHAGIDTGRLRDIDADALIVLLGVALPLLSSAKNAIRELIGPDLDDDAQREYLARSIADILMHGVLPRAGEPLDET